MNEYEMFAPESIATERLQFAAFLLAIIAATLVLLYFYVAAKTVDKAIKYADPSDKGKLEFISSLFCPFVAYYLTENKLDAACRKNGIEHQNKAILYLVLALMGLPWADLLLLYTDLKQFDKQREQDNLRKD